ncbi:PIR Superfamily Protein [Plasmodium ovale curtisi]|uniref:PIR Superfamily Protein n=1 Tax=Plasmodium ovale curtisi TaxID=864141 RepID=A0A1A8WAY9_PLAOA|nr:PIR Superfamily Protein [Plasmodium ovale curtisi]SBT01356.1 PIR Superfamily Protein [Plasmodium ovale curtisi]
MTKVIILNDIPSKKYNNELKREIHYEDILRNIEGDRLTKNLYFWQRTLPEHLDKYINSHMNEWSENNNKKRCRALNYILDFILKTIKEKK